MVRRKMKGENMNDRQNWKRKGEYVKGRLEGRGKENI